MLALVGCAGAESNGLGVLSGGPGFSDGDPGDDGGTTTEPDASSDTAPSSNTSTSVGSEPDDGEQPEETGTTEGQGTSTGAEIGSDESGGGLPGEACSPEELELIGLANTYRTQNGLPAVAVNEELCALGHIHAVDLAEQAPHQAGANCSLHSWSNAGPWTPCCYTPDLEQAHCMWSKPGELTAYIGNGLEVAAASANPAVAFAAMQADSAGNGVLLNIGIWNDMPWQAVGAGIYDGYAVLWFGPNP